ncbi:MAG: hypothetical protein JNM00_10000 [Flavobacteriales bacterium]|nr:hypothetical protein [Flavobacteriales bacterium]
MTVQPDISHITCYGFADGVISVEISGATPPYDLLWNNGSSDSEISGLGPGTYTLTVTDAVGYVNQQSFDIIEPELLSAGALLMPIPCFGDEALVEIFGFGGTPPYNGTGIEFYGAGQYDVLVTDDNFCETIISFEMESPEPLSATATGAAIACFGDTDTIEVQAAGGTPPYSGTGEFEVTTPGDIVYQVVDNNGCVAQAVSVVTAIDGPSMSISSTFTSCATSCDGTAEVEFSNLQLPYSFVWSDGSSDEVRTDLCSGAITATLSDASGCVVESEISIGSPEPITFGYTADTLLCNGDSTLVAVVVGGNQGSVNFEWSDGATEDVLYLHAGEYVVTATDSVGCASQLQFALFQPDAIVTEVLSNDPLCATSADGGIELLVTGGTGAYTFMWNDASGDNSINGLPGGDYDYLVTDANNCSVSGTVTLTAPAPLEVSVESIINDDGTGDISLEISGGTPPFEVLWSNGSTDAALTLTTGSYTAVVTDENGCTFTTETIVVPVGLIETETDEPCFIYNAGTGMLHLTCPEFTTTRIYDVSGKQVAMTKDNWISLQGIETGLYTIVLAGNTVVHSGRFVVNGL